RRAPRPQPLVSISRRRKRRLMDRWWACWAWASSRRTCRRPSGGIRKWKLAGSLQNASGGKEWHPKGRLRGSTMPGRSGFRKSSPSPPPSTCPASGSWRSWACAATRPTTLITRGLRRGTPSAGTCSIASSAQAHRNKAAAPGRVGHLEQHRRASRLLRRAHEIGHVVNGRHLALVDLEDHLPRQHALLQRIAAFHHLGDHHSGDLLVEGERSARLVVERSDVDTHQIAQSGGRTYGLINHLGLSVPCRLRNHLLTDFEASERDVEDHLRSLAQDLHRNRRPNGRLGDHPRQVAHSLDLLAVELQDDVALED